MARCLLLTDFNPDTLAAQIDNDEAAPGLASVSAPWPSLRQILKDGSHDVWDEEYDVALVWTRPEATIPAFGDLASFALADLDRIENQVDELAADLLRLPERVPIALMTLWTLPAYARGLGVGDLKPGGVRHALFHMNRCLIERLQDTPNLFIVDPTPWLVAAGPAATDPSYWFMAKLPFSPAVFKRATAELKSAVRVARRGMRKVLVVDLDDTLWGGIIGEVGLEGIALGGHDAIGEAFVAFQKALKALRNRGVLLAIASKNESDVALEAIRTHPEMVLREDDFAAMRIDWNDKAQNVAELASELGVGLDDVVFVDDSAAERARVEEALPGVLVPDWPNQRMHYASTLLELTCFDTVGLTVEDRARSDHYRVQRARDAAKRAAETTSDWLQQLETRVVVESFSERNLKRIAQLLNKTNQMNLATRRLTEAELAAWCRSTDRRLWSLRLSDRFGDAGLVGVVSVEAGDGRAKIVDFVLSCRVIGRDVERLMAHRAIEHARELDLESVQARYVPTSRNAPCLTFWRQSGFVEEIDGSLFSWSVKHVFEPPPDIAVEHRSA